MYYIYTGGVVPRHVTRVRIDESLTVIPAWAFEGRQNITELDCHVGVKKVEEFAFRNCRSLRRVIMPGVNVVARNAFFDCVALIDVECVKLERIGHAAFGGCEFLKSIDLSSIKVVQGRAFISCLQLKNVKFGEELESIRSRAFLDCTSLDRITIPLKDGMINTDNIFQECKSLKHVDLVEGAVLHETIASLQMEEWKIDMNEEIASINQILPNTPAGNLHDNDNAGGKAQAIRSWIRSVLHKVVQYKAEHRCYLNEAATTLQPALPNDIVFKNVLPFLELPAYTFEGEDD